MSNHHDHDHNLPMDQLPEEDRGLRYDLPGLVTRRNALRLGGSAIAVSFLAACGSSNSNDSSTGASGDSTGTSQGGPGGGQPPAGGGGGGAMGGESNDDLVDGEIENETAGPYPGDGSNGTNVLDDTGIVRSDITQSLDGSATADGVPLTFRITVRDLTSGDAMAGAGVYAWHCDRDGQYSMYASGLEDVTYLRGVQQADDTGTVEFKSIFPACYSGRWPHIHFEVYSTVDDATAQDGDNPIVKTSQIALPKDTCEKVYATTGYEQSVSNLSQVSLATDGVFGDDSGIHQIASMSGNVTDGYTASLTIGVVGS